MRVELRALFNEKGAQVPRYRTFSRYAAVAAATAFLCVGIPPSIAAEDTELARAGALTQQVLNLAKQGRYADAAPIATAVLAILEKALGPDHPDVVMSLNVLAMLYDKQGRYVHPAVARSLKANRSSRRADMACAARRYA
jgi:tetratricopeptide repeat protein